MKAGAPTGSLAERRLEPGRTHDRLLRDEQSLLAGAVGRLRESTGSRCVAAWTAPGGGPPQVAAAAFEGAPPRAPGADAWAAAASLERATSLPDASLPASLATAIGRGAGAVAPVRATDGRVLAVLAIALPESAAGRVRPRTLATLDAAARRLATPLAAARAVRSLGDLDGEIRRLDRLSTLGALAAEIAHEVRSPLVAVKTFLQLLPERRDEPDFVEGFLSVATDELARVERLLDLVVDFPHTREERGAGSPGQALDATADLLVQSAHGRGLRLEVHRPEELPEVTLGDDALRQVLLNLALNALEASPRGGRVLLEARAAGADVELRVSDEGPGIPESERTRIFEAFHSTRGEGHGGLGLAIAARSIEAAGGSIHAEEAPGGGASFVVRLPRAGSA